MGAPNNNNHPMSFLSCECQRIDVPINTITFEEIDNTQHFCSHSHEVNEISKSQTKGLFGFCLIPPVIQAETVNINYYRSFNHSFKFSTVFASRAHLSLFLHDTNIQFSSQRWSSTVRIEFHSLFKSLFCKLLVLCCHPPQFGPNSCLISWAKLYALTRYIVRDR